MAAGVFVRQSHLGDELDRRIHSRGCCHDLPRRQAAPTVSGIDVTVSGVSLRPDQLSIRAVASRDFAQWRPLWDGYNAFYGRQGATALPEAITLSTWQRFLDPTEPVHALIATRQERVVGLVHYLFHRSTTRLTSVCYLQDLFTLPEQRRQGIARHLIEEVFDAARAAGASRVYWQTQASNTAGRSLYDRLGRHEGFIVYTREL